MTTDLTDQAGSKFLRNAWYVFGWVKDLDAAGEIIGSVLLGEPIVVWRDTDGELHAMEDRCPHRHAPLSMGRVEPGGLRCKYHGLLVSTGGQCAGMPLCESPPELAVRTYQVAAEDGWIWIWMGSPQAGDIADIPGAFGLDDPQAPMRCNSIEYDAHYQLVHDNLCDLSHVDFVHETTLKIATGADWSATAPHVRLIGRALRFERWFVDAKMPGSENLKIDVWSTYDFVAPGIFIMNGARFPAGTAASCQFGEPRGLVPLMRNIEQQAVTPISTTRTAYHFATGLIGDSAETTAKLASRMDVVMAAFEEDRKIIEAQQRIWNLTSPEVPRHFFPQDKAPRMMRRLMDRLIREENQA